MGRRWGERSLACAPLSRAHSRGSLRFWAKASTQAVAILGALTQDFLGDGLDLVNVAEEVDDVLWAGEQGRWPRMTTRSKG